MLIASNTENLPKRWFFHPNRIQRITSAFNLFSDPITFDCDAADPIDRNVLSLRGRWVLDIECSISFEPSDGGTLFI